MPDCWAWRNIWVKAHPRDVAGSEQVAQNLAGADRGELIDVADQAAHARLAGSP